MKHEITQGRRVLLAVLLLGMQCFFLKVFLGFSLRRTIGITATVGGLLIIIGMHFFIDDQKIQTKKYLFFHLSSIAVLCLALYSIGQACYIENITYFNWLGSRGSYTNRSIDFEFGTCLLGAYFIFLYIYSKELIGLARKNIVKWLPSFESIILGIYIYVALDAGYNHVVKNTALFVSCALCSIYIIFQAARSNEDKTHLKVSLKYYLPIYFMAIFFIAGVAYYFPKVRELPGTRPLHHFFNAFGAKTDLEEWIPEETNLSSEVPISEAELFEVQATEPLYLRNIAYNNYEDGKWSIGEDQNYDAYIPFKPQYLEAEYKQEDALLDEVLWLNSQDASLLPEYSILANYEKSVIGNRSYLVIQNPINKINYFTVNGFQKIEDEGISKIYYYHNLHNDYFYSDHLIEPSAYEVTYADRVPKVGSREYIFLHQMNGKKWQALYDEVLAARKMYNIYYDKTPKILMTYTQVIQYKNACFSFMQIPENLEEPLSSYAEQIVGEEQSDWGRAERIANYLKTNYVYSTQSKKEDGERVLSFLFENKEGICQDFATSMVLMCRSIGLPAKYVTGYLVSDKNTETGNYVVKEKDAHAFVEVYLAGYGWMTFDPTPAVDSTALHQQGIQEIQMSDVVNFIGTLVIIIMLFILSSAGRGYLRGKWWKIKYLLSPPQEKLEQLLRHTLGLLAANGFAKKRYETLSQYTERLEKEQIDIKAIAKPYENQKYGMQIPSKEALEAAYVTYNTLKKQLTKKQK